jgi:hypothetical protein
MSSADDMALLLKHMENQPKVGFAIIKRERGDVVVSYEFGQEAPDSPMYAGASYGIGDNIDAALHQITDEMRLK